MHEFMLVGKKQGAFSMAFVLETRKTPQNLVETLEVGREKRGLSG